MTAAVTDAVKTLADAESRFGLQRTERASFFPEWQNQLPALSSEENHNLNELRQRYLYQRSVGQLLEGTVTLLLASPLLAIAGFYDPPFIVRAEDSIQIEIEDSAETLQGRINVLVIKDNVWVVVLESKKIALTAWSALPQTLAYFMANPEAHRPSFGMVSNGDDIFFVKLLQQPQPQFSLSRVFSPFTSEQDLQNALRVLKQLGEVAK